MSTIPKKRKHLNETKGYQNYNTPNRSQFSGINVKYSTIEDILEDMDTIQNFLQQILDNKNNKGQLILNESTIVNFTENDVYVKIEGNFSDGSATNFIVDNDNNRLTYIGEDLIFLAVGVSDIQVSKTCTITFGLYKNDELIENAETEHTFTSAAKTSNISIVRLCPFTKNDYVEVWAKSSDVDVVLTIKSLMVVLWGNNVI